MTYLNQDSVNELETESTPAGDVTGVEEQSEEEKTTTEDTVEVVAE